MGELIVSFLGPPPNDFLTRTALEILGLYLASSSVAPLNKEYVEIESPLWYICTIIWFSGSNLPVYSSYILFTEEIRATYINLPIYITSVPTKHLDTFNEKLTASLTRIVENGIDMQRMTIVINRNERQVCSQHSNCGCHLTKSEQLRRSLESSKGDYFSPTIISDFLYGAEDGSDLDRSMDGIGYHNTLRSWTNSQWAALLSKYVFCSYSSSILPRNGCRFYLEQPSVVILGKPSARLADNLEESEKARIANQVEKLGPEGLKKVEQKLETAKEILSKPIPTDILTSFPVPDVKSIFRIPVQSVQEPGMGRKANLRVPTNGELQKHIESDGKPLPFFVEYDHVEVCTFVFYSLFF